MNSRGKIKQDFLGRSPLDMSQYTKIFGMCRIPGLKRDSLHQNPDARHIVVAYNNHVILYKFIIIKIFSYTFFSFSNWMSTPPTDTYLKKLMCSKVCWTLSTRFPENIATSLWDFSRQKRGTLGVSLTKSCVKIRSIALPCSPFTIRYWYFAWIKKVQLRVGRPDIPIWAGRFFMEVDQIAIPAIAGSTKLFKYFFHLFYSFNVVNWILFIYQWDHFIGIILFISL